MLSTSWIIFTVCIYSLVCLSINLDVYIGKRLALSRSATRQLCVAGMPVFLLEVGQVLCDDDGNEIKISAKRDGATGF